LRPSSFKGGRDENLILCADSFFYALHNGKDNLAFLAFPCLDSPYFGIVDAGQEQAFGFHREIAHSLGRASVSVSLPQNLSLLLGVKAGLDFPATVEFAMSPIIVESPRVGEVVGMGIVDEVLYFLTIPLIILALIFIIDLGFDIEEGISLVLAPLAPILLEVSQRTPLHWSEVGRGLLYLLNILVLVIIVFFFPAVVSTLIFVG
jgi:hypothetical protein